MIYCCGEVLSERENNQQFEVVGDQILEGLFHLSKEQMKEVVIAYEPVWAIGTGVTASPNKRKKCMLLSEAYCKTIWRYNS